MKMDGLVLPVLCSAAMRRINETMSDMDKSNLARAVLLLWEML